MKINLNKIKPSKKVVFPLLSVVASLIIGAIIILISGENPFIVYYYMLIQPIFEYKNLLNILHTMTPLIMTGIAFIIANKAGMINLGLEGQLLLGSLSGVFIATLFPKLPFVLYIPIIFIVAMIVGGIWAAIPGILKLKFNASEIVTCIMLNYVAQFIVNLIVSGGYFKHPDIEQRTPYIAKSAHMSSLGEIGLSQGSIVFRGVQLNIMFIIAIGVAVLAYILFKKTRWGYEMDAVGKNIIACQSNKLNAKKIMMLSIVLSGAVAGISAMGEVLGTFNGLVEGFSPGYGFSGISVALLGGGGPIGVIFGASFFSLMNQGMMYISANTAVPKDFVKVIQTLVIIFIVMTPFFEAQYEKIKLRKNKKKEVVL